MNIVDNNALSYRRPGGGFGPKGILSVPHVRRPPGMQIDNRNEWTREAREWLFTFPLPPIPVQSIPIPSRSNSQFCHQFPLPWESHGIYITIGNPIPIVISSLLLMITERSVALQSCSEIVSYCRGSHKTISQG